MGDSTIFRMLEAYTSFSIDLKMRFAKDPKAQDPSIREEIEARPGVGGFLSAGRRGRDSCSPRPAMKLRKSGTGH